MVCDRLAAEAGVSAGQKLSTALGLQPGLGIIERDLAREMLALESLACWAGRFTPVISLVPAGLLLEIGACLRLFGGLNVIVEAALAGCADQRYSTVWAVAPTPLGAFWLARAGAVAAYPTEEEMQAALGRLSCAVTGWPEAVLKRLEAFGLRSLADLRALPGSGLRRRIGNAPVDDLLRAWGALPDPQLPFVFPERFSLGLELPSRVEDAEALVFAGQRLFAALSGWLHGRQLLVRACSLQLTHDDGSQSTLSLRFAEPAADEMRFLRLLREHLSRLQLAAPVEAVRLLAEEVIKKPGGSTHLFDQPIAGEGTLACLERLRARLGEAAVQSLGMVADYRPECATKATDVAMDFGQKSPSTAAGNYLADSLPPSRPLWLFPVPQALAERSGGPQWHGPLKLLSRAERLESGWWDEGEAQAAGDVRRDYFVACNPQGQWAWIFRDAEGWFLHGLFA